jgi:hypothetical protein
VGVRKGGFIWEEAFPRWPPVTVLDVYGLSPAGPVPDLGLPVMRDWTHRNQAWHANKVLNPRCLSLSGCSPERVNAHTTVVHEPPGSIRPSPNGGMRELVYLLPRPGLSDLIQWGSSEGLHKVELPSDLIRSVARVLNHPEPPRVVVVGMEDYTHPASSERVPDFFTRARGEDIYGIVRRYVAGHLTNFSRYKAIGERVALLHFASRAELDNMGLHPATVERAEPMPDEAWRTRPNQACNYFDIWLGIPVVTL